MKTVLVPAQIRAARALLEWSQDQLAKEADVGLSSVRDVESERRADDTDAVKSIRRALENGGVSFVEGDATAGPGVRLIAGRPNVIRRPTVMTMWDGLPFAVEWQGKKLNVCVSREALDDLGRFRENQTDAVYVSTFDRHRGSILHGIEAAASDPSNYDRRGFLHVGGKHIADLA